MTQVEHDKAVEDIASALKQVVSVNPQLLYEAAVKVYSELAIDSITAELREGATEKSVFRARLRAGLCQWLATTLLRGGHATMTGEQVANAIAFASLGRRS